MSDRAGEFPAVSGFSLVLKKSSIDKPNNRATLNANGKLGLKRDELEFLDLRAAGPTNQFNAKRKYTGIKKDLLVQLIEPMKVTSVRRDHLRKANVWLA